MFTDLSFIDKNFAMDITKELTEAESCFWFTLPLAVYRMVGEDSEYNVYEYLSFPTTATDEEHLRFFSVSQPYFWNYDYMGGLNKMMGDQLEDL